MAVLPVFHKRFTTLFSEDVVPQPIVIEQASQCDEEFLQISKRLGINTIPLQMMELAEAVRGLGIGLYEYETVTRYLDALVKRAQPSFTPWPRLEWNWHPIRDTKRFVPDVPEHVSRSVYNKAIPIPVMLTIERIEAKFPKALCYVSDIRTVADPFLAVTVEGAETMLVVERWDEPAFRS
jgi:hypothetical protein